VEGEPSTSKYQESFVCDDKLEDAKQEITDALHYYLHLLQKCKYIMDYITEFHHTQKKWKMNLKN
jgi:hypothetical protein